MRSLKISSKRQRSRSEESLPPFSATREGKRFLLAVIVIGFASLNTGNNLMYLIFSMMLAITLLGLLTPPLMLRGVGLTIEPVGDIYANIPTGMRVILKNKNKLIPLRSVKLMSEFFGQPINIPSLRGGDMLDVTQQVVFGRRGRYPALPIKIETTYPFIFFIFRKRVDVRANLLVYPEPYDLRKYTPGLIRSVSSSAVNSRTGEEFSHIREFRYGDPVRRIDWKKTARLGELMSRVYHDSEINEITIMLDNTPSDTDEFERAVSFSASLAAFYLQMGCPVRFITCSKAIPFGTGEEQYIKILDLLAELDFSSQIECILPEDIRGHTILILLSGHSPFSRFLAEAGEVFHARDI